jgi:hypothetical protein
MARHTDSRTLENVLEIIAEENKDLFIEFLASSSIIDDDDFLEELSQRVFAEYILQHLDTQEIINYILENVTIENYGLKLGE